MIVVIGEILIDLFDDYERIGGAPFNFAFHLKQLGWPVRFITRVGDDAHGRKILELLERHQFDAGGVQIDASHPTGTVKVTLTGRGVPQFDIRREVAYDYIDFDRIGRLDRDAVRMLYIGTLAQRTDHGFHGFERLLSSKAAAAKVYCDINLRPPHVRSDAIQASLGHADILKLNTDELRFVGELLGGPAREAPLIGWLAESFGLEMAVLTRGEAGSILFKAGHTYTAPTPAPAKIIDTVGAGDAFAAVIAAGYLRKAPPDTVLSAATGFAAQICTLPGAIPDDPSIYDAVRRQLEGDTHAR